MKQFLARACLAFASAGLAAPSQAAGEGAAAWKPDGPVSFVLGFGAGGGHYALAQIMQMRMSEELGQTVVIMPKPGAQGMIAAGFTAQARPDGRTISMVGPAQMAILPFAKRASFSPFDLTLVSRLVSMSYAIVTRPDQPEIKTLQDAIDLSKHADVTYGSIGPGSTNSLTGYLINAMSGSKFRDVGYKNGGQALLAAMSGETTLAVGDTASHELIASGRLRALATTGATREARFPDVPTVAETIPGFQVTNWIGIIAPPGTPREAADRYRQVFAKILAEPDVVEKVRQLAMTPIVTTPEEFRDTVRTEIDRWGKLMKDNHITLE